MPAIEVTPDRPHATTWLGSIALRCEPRPAAVGSSEAAVGSSEATVSWSEAARSTREAPVRSREAAVPTREALHSTRPAADFVSEAAVSTNEPPGGACSYRRRDIGPSHPSGSSARVRSRCPSFITSTAGTIEADMARSTHHSAGLMSNVRKTGWSEGTSTATR